MSKFYKLLAVSYILFFILPSESLFAQQRVKNIEKTKGTLSVKEFGKRTSLEGKSKMKLLAEGDCEIFREPFDSLKLYSLSFNDGSFAGFLSGANANDDQQIANFFDFSTYASNNFINAAIIYFGVATSSDLTKIVPIRVYDGTSGSVGAELGHVDLTMKEISDSVDAQSYNAVDFSNIALPASKKIFVSVDLSNLDWYENDDLAVLSNKVNELPINTGWKQSSDADGNAADWEDFKTVYNVNLSLYIFPVVGVSDGCTQIVTPVTLSSFSANRFGTANKLTWTTVSESASKGFEVQRSADGVNFTTIAFLPSQAIGGNSTATLNYSYADNAVLPNNNYYRIKQIDLTSKATFTKTLLLFTDKLKKEGIVQAYPNPVKNNLNLILDLGASKNNTLTVVDLAGRTLLQKSVQGSNGNQTTTLNVANLAKGTYFVKLTGEGNKKLVKFIKE